MILIAKSFQKSLGKLKSIELWDIFREIKKHSMGIENLAYLYEISGRKVLKGYLPAWRVRLIVLYQYKDGKYIPCYTQRELVFGVLRS